MLEAPSSSNDVISPSKRPQVSPCAIEMDCVALARLVESKDVNSHNDIDVSWASQWDAVSGKAPQDVPERARYGLARMQAVNGDGCKGDGCNGSSYLHSHFINQSCCRMGE